MDKRSRGYVWTGAALAAAGLGAALVAWVGLDRANQYIGVPAAVAAFLGLALSVYGVVALPPDPGGSGGAGTKVTQSRQNVRIGGNAVMVGQERRSGDADPAVLPDAEITQTADDVTVTGSDTMIGQRDTAAGSDPE